MALAVALGAAILLSGCGASARRVGSVQRTLSPKARLASGARARIAVIVMENEEYASIIGSPQAPYINRLAKRYALAGASYATSHPSLPNYLAMTGGSSFGISSDCTTCTVKASSLVDQLELARLSWRAYMEDLPHPCFGVMSVEVV